jgi:hypothetical protein
MTITPRTLLASIAASSIFGGGVGALATAATTSQASPAAIAAAVTRVKDSAAEERLTAITRTLESINENLGGSGTGRLLVGISPDAYELLHKICLNTNPSFGGC